MLAWSPLSKKREKEGLDGSTDSISHHSPDSQ